MWIESRWGETTTIAGLLVLASVFYFFVVPWQVDSDGGAGLSPRFAVDVVVYGIAILCLQRLARLWMRPAASEEVEYNEHLTDSEPRHYRRIGLIFVGCLIYSYLFIDLIGFYASSALVMFCFAFLMGERRIAMLVLYPLRMAGLLYALFDVGFQMRMPAGGLIPYIQAG